MLEVKIEKEEIERLKSFFRSTNEELNRAANRSIRQTINWAKTVALKDVSSQSNIQQKILKTRTKTSTNPTKKEGRLWLGTYRVSLIRLNAKQNKKGVKAGTRGAIFVKSAFLAPIKNSQLFTHQVFKRVGKKRLPIEKQVQNYSAEAMNIRDRIMPNINAELIKRLRRELKWEASKR